MPLGHCALVVDDTRLMLEVLRQVLHTHFNEILTAESYREAVRHLDARPIIDTVVTDVYLEDGNGFQILDKLENDGRTDARVLFVTARWNEVDQQRALDRGAVGYLSKPVSMADIRGALSSCRYSGPRNRREPTLARIWLIDSERRERLLSFGIHDISSSGALIDTTGPLPVGTELEFEIVHREDEGVIRVRGTVVRVQEPSWVNPGGAAVRFDWIDSPQSLAQLVEGSGGTRRSN